MAVCGGGGFVGIVVDRLDLGSRGAGLEPAKAKVGGVTEAKRAGDGGGEVEFQSEPEPLGRLYATATDPVSTCHSVRTLGPPLAPAPS